MPGNLDLTGNTAVVTRGRINLGFHTALRLLRCGASVILSTRYPYDAETRYKAEVDSKLWMGRLKLVGADFRNARDVFHLVATIQTILRDGKNDISPCMDGALFILINNAAQTLTDSVEQERKAITNERNLQTSTIEGPRSVVRTNYEATIRGGSLMRRGLLDASHINQHEIEQANDDNNILQTTQGISNTITTNITQNERILTASPTK